MLVPNLKQLLPSCADISPLLAQCVHVFYLVIGHWNSHSIIVLYLLYRMGPLVYMWQAKMAMKRWWDYYYSQEQRTYPRMWVFTDHQILLIILIIRNYLLLIIAVTFKKQYILLQVSCVFPLNKHSTCNIEMWQVTGYWTGLMRLWTIAWCLVPRMIIVYLALFSLIIMTSLFYVVE